MAQDELLLSVSERIKEIKSDISRLDEYLSVLKETGEDVTTMEADKRKLTIQLKKWEDVLKRRGY